MSEFISKLNNLKLKELRDLASRYNLSQKIDNIYKLKKNELIIHLLMNIDAVKKIYYDDLTKNQIRAEKGLSPLKERKKPERRPKEQKKLMKDIDELNMERIKLSNEIVAEKDEGKRQILMKKQKEIGKKLGRLSPYIESDPEAERKKAEEAQKIIEEEKKAEEERLKGQTNEQKKYRLKMEIDQIGRTIKNLEKKEKQTVDTSELSNIAVKKNSLYNQLISKDNEYKELSPEIRVKEQIKLSKVEEPKIPKVEDNYDILSGKLQNLIYMTSLDDIKKALIKSNYKGRIQTNKILLNMQLLQNFNTIDKIKNLISLLEKKEKQTVDTSELSNIEESKKIKEPENKEGILSDLNKLENEFNILNENLFEFISKRRDLFSEMYKNIPDKDKPRNQAQAKKIATKLNKELDSKQNKKEYDISKILKNIIKIKIDNGIQLNDDEKEFLDDEEKSTQIFNLEQYKEIVKNEKELEKKRKEEEKEYNRELTIEEINKKYKNYIYDFNKDMPNRETFHIIDKINSKQPIQGLVYNYAFQRANGSKVDGAYIITKKLLENNINLSNPIFKKLLKALKEEYKGDIFDLNKKFNIDYKNL